MVQRGGGWGACGWGACGWDAQECALPLAVLTDHERGPPTSHATQQAQGAQVAICAPEVSLPDVWEPLSAPATLLGLASLAQPPIGHAQALRVEAHQGWTRPGRRPGGASCLAALRSRRPMMAIQDLALRARQPPGVTGPQGRDHGLGKRGRVPYERGGYPRCAALERMVQGRGRHPKGGCVGLIRRMHGGRDPDDVTHQRHQRGKQSLTGLVSLGGAGTEGIQT